MEENKQNINDMSNKEFTDHAWSNMLSTLDQEMPVEKKRRKFGFWLWPFAALLISGAIALFNYELRMTNGGENYELQITNYDNRTSKNTTTKNPDSQQRSAPTGEAAPKDRHKKQQTSNARQSQNR